MERRARRRVLGGKRGGGTETERTSGLLSKEVLLVFSAFFLWGFGTGVLRLARPILAFDLGRSFFLVGLVSAFSAGLRMIGTPLAGSLADRLWRRPVMIAEAAMHGGAAAMQAFTNSHAVFLGLEILSGFGVAVRNTATRVGILKRQYGTVATGLDEAQRKRQGRYGDSLKLPSGVGLRHHYWSFLRVILRIPSKSGCASVDVPGIHG